MTNVFETGATLVLKDDFTVTFEKFIRGADGADRKVAELSRKLNALGPDFEGMARKIGGNLVGIDTALGNTIKKLVNVGGAFGGWDLASKAAKDAVLFQVGDMSTKALDQLGGMKLKSDEAFSQWGAAASAATSGVLDAMRTMDASINATVTRMSGLLSQMERVGAAAGGMAHVPSLPGSPEHNENLRRAADHGYGRGARALMKAGSQGFEAASMLLPFEVNPVTAGLAVTAASGYEAIMQGHAGAMALMGGNLDAKAYGLDVPTLVARMKRGASETGDSFDAVAEAYTAGSRILQGVDPKTRLNLVESLLKPAEYEAQLKGVPLGESVKAMLELAHQTSTYDTAAIQKMASQFSIASLNSNDGLDALTRQSAYFLPQLHAAIGMDFGSGVSLEVAAQNAGLQRAGTSVKSFFENAFSKTGKGSDAHNDALRALGLIGTDDKPLWQMLGKDGTTDWTASELHLGEMIEKKIAGMDDTGRSDTLHHAFGEQGGRLAALLSTKAFREQVEGIKGRVDQFGGDGDLLGQLKKVDPLQQWRETWTDLKNVLGDIGEKILPPLNFALHTTDEGLKAIHKTFSLFDDFLSHGDAANRPMTQEEKSRAINPGIHKSAFEEIAGGGRDGPLADAIAGGFLKAFRELQGGGSNVPDITGGGFIQAAYTTFGDHPAFTGSLPSIRHGRPHSYGAGLPTAGAGRGGDSPDLVSRAHESWNFWKSKGASDSVAAGLLGMEEGENNFLANSGMFGGWGDKGAAYGSFMWHADRRAQIAAGLGVNVIGASHLDQLRSAHWEMIHGSRAGLWKRLTEGNLSPFEASKLSVIGFEGPKDIVGNVARRGARAEHWYGKFHDMPVVTAPPARRASPGAPASHDDLDRRIEAAIERGLSKAQIVAAISRDRHTASAIGKMASNHIASRNREPRSVGGPDWHGTYQHPGSDGTDVA